MTDSTASSRTRESSDSSTSSDSEVSRLQRREAMSSEPPDPAATARATLVIPAHNAAATLRRCLGSVAPLQERGELLEVVVVDDRSTDETAAIAAEFPVRVITGRGIGAAAARNDGITQSAGEFIWCMDADCIANDRTLSEMMACFDDDIAAVGGSLGNACPKSLLANFVQDEIRWRHTRMPTAVNFLASGNVVYCRSAFLGVGGFDESFRWAHDAELAYRFKAAGHNLRFCRDAVVLHHHFTKWGTYLLKQAAYAKNRMLLYERFPRNVRGDDYSSWVDHLQPPLALLFLLTLPLALVQNFRIVPLMSLLVLLGCSLVTTCSIYKGHPRWRSVGFLLFSFVRSISRALGACRGVAAVSVRRFWNSPSQVPQERASQ